MNADHRAMPGSDSLTGHQIDRLTHGMHLVPASLLARDERPLLRGTRPRHVRRRGRRPRIQRLGRALHRSVLAPLAAVDVTWTRFDG